MLSIRMGIASSTHFGSYRVPFEVGNAPGVDHLITGMMAYSILDAIENAKSMKALLPLE